MHIDSLYRYPVKGLSPEDLPQAILAPGCCIPWDRAFALAQGDASFDAANPAWVPKTNFMCLLRNARIALLKTSFNDRKNLLTIVAPDATSITANPLTAEGRAHLTQFLTLYLGPEAWFGTNQTPPSFHHIPDHSFCDHVSQVVSLIGLGSLGALTAVAGHRDKRRFRANIYVDNIPPWEEFNWLGKSIRIGTATLLVQDRIDRCGATSVNPDTAIRDANPVRELQQNFGHVDLGVFAEVTNAGTIKPGDIIQII
ncbi:MAG: MOSC domain-containing protein [Acidocella sp.]|nr:MOSC domain-containing protein [Acidocella sp.]